MKYPLFLVLVICFFGFHTPAYSQLNPLTDNEVVFDMTPENPGPNSSVTIYLNSYSSNINTATVTWKVNGTTRLTGIGEKSFTFSTGNAGTVTRVDISVVTSDGITVDKMFSIRPSSIDLIWEADGNVPPFYKGKALFSHQNRIKFVAMPHITGSNGQEISARTLVYTWVVNGTVMDKDSGYGRNSFSMNSPLISRALNVRVTASTPDGNSSAYTATTASQIEPSILMYRKDPLYGIEFQEALSGISVMKDSQEVTIVGIPLFFNKIGGLSYTWSINGNRIDSDTTTTSRVFKRLPGVSGESTISLAITHQSKILQYAKSSFNLMFQDNPTNQNETF